MLAAAAQGVDVSSWNPPDHEVHPSGPGPCDDFYRQYRNLYPTTADVAHFLADQQKTADGGDRGNRV